MKPLMVVLYFFFAHRAVSFMYSYLPHALPNPVIGLVGIAVFLVTVFIFFSFHFNTWHLCNLFFAGMITTFIVRLALPEQQSLLASDILQGFSQMGYIASYYLLGYALARYTNYQRFRRIILVVFTISLLLHMGPNLISRHVPQHLALIGGALSLLLFVIFVLLSPVFSREMFVVEDREQDLLLRRAQKMQEAGLTAREVEIVNLLLTGKMLKECAVDMNITVDTAKFHSRNVYRKLGIQGRSELQKALQD